MQLVFYLLKASVLMAGIHFLAGSFAVSRFWVVVLGVYLLSVPVFVCAAYTGTIHKITRLARFSNQGLLFRVLSGRTLKLTFWICWALLSSFFMLVQFHTYDELQWKVFFLTVPVFGGVYALSRRFLAKELKPYLIVCTALEWSRIVTPLLMVLVYTAVSLRFSAVPEYVSILDAIDARKSEVADMTGSSLVLQFSQSLAVYDGIKAYALSRFGEQEAIGYAIVSSLGALIVFYNACAMLSCLLIPSEEYLRLFTPLSTNDRPEPISGQRIALISALTTFVTFFIYLPIFSYIEMAVQADGVNRFRQVTESFITLNLERIDNAYFRSGTLDRLNKAKARAIQQLREFDDSIGGLDRLTDAAFARMEGNVDGYLDWYYSLEGEYGRVSNLLIGELDNYMKEKLEESLEQKDAFREVQDVIVKAIAVHDEVQAEYRKVAEKIMADNRVDPAFYSINVRQQISLENALNPPLQQDIIDLKNRLMLSTGSGAVVGLVTAAIGKKIVAKIAGKTVLKTASKALTKVVASKPFGTASGAAVGAAAGAAVGSLLPGIGTMIGGVVGGVIGGVVGGVAADALILKLDEEMNREEFRKEILASIDAARKDFKASLGLTQPNQVPR